MGERRFPWKPHVERRLISVVTADVLLLIAVALVATVAWMGKGALEKHGQ